MIKSIIDSVKQWQILIGIALAIVLVILVAYWVLYTGSGVTGGPTVPEMGISNIEISNTSSGFSLNISLYKLNIRDEGNTSMELIYYGNNQTIITRENVNITSSNIAKSINRNFSRRPCVIWIKGPKTIELKGMALRNNEYLQYTLNDKKVSRIYNLSYCN